MPAMGMTTTATAAEQMGGEWKSYTRPRRDTENDLRARIRELEAENKDLRKMNHTLPSPSRTESWYDMLLSAPAEIYDMALGGCGLRREGDVNAIEAVRGLLPVVSETPSSPQANLTPLISPYGYILPHVRFAHVPRVASSFAPHPISTCYPHRTTLLHPNVLHVAEP
jgi:hypothetical protein